MTLRKLFVIGLSSACAVSNLPAAIIIQEDWNRTGAIHNKDATVFSSAITAAGGSATWVARDGAFQFNANGTLTFDAGAADDGSAYLNLGNYINNSKGSATGIFDLQMTIGDITTGNATNTWTSLGFSILNQPDINTQFTRLSEADSNGTGVATTIVRQNGTVSFFAGPDTDNSLANANPGNGISNTLRINLDLSKYNGTTNFGTVSYFLNGSSTATRVFNYTSANNFNALLISVNDQSNGRLSSLTLSQVEIPEPSGLLVGFGGCALLILRRSRT